MDVFRGRRDIFYRGVEEELFPVGPGRPTLVTHLQTVPWRLVALDDPSPVSEGESTTTKRMSSKG